MTKYTLPERYGDSSQQDNPATEAGFLLNYKNLSNQNRLLFGGTCIYNQSTPTRDMVYYTANPSVLPWQGNWNNYLVRDELDEIGIQGLSRPLTANDYGTCDAAFIGSADFLVFGTYRYGMPEKCRPCVFSESIPSEGTLLLGDEISSGGNQREYILRQLPGELSMRLDLPQGTGSSVEVEIFDCSGRLVTAISGTLASEIHVPASGIYYALIKNDTGEVSVSRCAVFR